MKLLIAQINPTVGDLRSNTEKIIHAINQGKKQDVDLVLFPELALTGYPPEDLLLLPHFNESVEHYLSVICNETHGIAAIVGTPRKSGIGKEKMLYNSAALFSDGYCMGFQDKILLPTYDVFDERRYFEPGNAPQVWELCNRRIAVTICEDLWQHSHLIRYTNYQRDPIEELQPEKLDLLLNLSASPYSIHKKQQRIAVCSKAAKSLKVPVILCNQVGANDGIIFDGHSLAVGADGSLLKMAQGFKEELLLIDDTNLNPNLNTERETIEELHEALILGLRDYFQKLGFKKACFGLSGGIDSALVCYLATQALGKENILAVSMPSRFSSKESITDALALAGRLEIKFQLIPIEPAYSSYLQLIEPYFNGLPFDVTEENIQARIRATLLMAISNKWGYIVLSTGNKSELAMGYSTLYGDMCGGLGVISDLTKRQVYELSKWINRNNEIIPWNSIHKAPSAELRPNQKDSDSLPDYEIIDNVLKAYLEEYLSPQQIAEQFHYPINLVEQLVKRIHQNEFKRRQSPPGLRISEKAFSFGRKFPIVQGWA